MEQHENKIIGAVRRHRFALTCFAFLTLYNFIVVTRFQPWKVSDITFTYHIVDYNTLGFRSQLLPGSLFCGIFGEHATRTAASVYETVLLLLFFLGLSFILERFFLHTEHKQRTAATILLLFYLSGPFTFAIFTNELGMLDFYWLFFSFLFFVFLENKTLRFLIPALYALSMLIHFSAVLNYLILFSVLLLYRISIEPEKRNKTAYTVVFVSSLAVTAGLFGFFLLYHTANLPAQEEFHRLIESRGGTYTGYYDYSLYYNLFGSPVLSPDTLSIGSPLLRVLHTIADKCAFTFQSYASNIKTTLPRLALTITLLTPPMCFYFKRTFRFFKSIRQNKLKRFCVFLMIIQFPFTAVVGCLFSPDIIRWCTHAFLISFTMLLYTIYHEPELRAEALGAIEEKKTAAPALLFFLAWFFTNSWAYC